MTIQAFCAYFNPLFAAYLRGKMDDVILQTAEAETLGPLIHFSLELSAAGDRLGAYMAYTAYTLTQKKDDTIILPVLFALELFRVFTVVHDDIADDSQMRHGKSTIHAQFSKSQAILLGDLYYMFAVQTIHEAPVSLQAKTLFLKMCRDVVVGQMHDVALVRRDPVMVTEEVLNRVIEMKSARTIFCYPVAIGLAVAGHSSLLLAARCCGSKIGHAFQRLDDLSDVIMTDNELGTHQCADIHHGTHTHLSRHMHTFAPSDELSVFGRYFGKRRKAEDLEPLVRAMHAAGAIAAEKQSIARILDEAEELSNILFSEPEIKKMWHGVILMVRNQLYRLSL